MSRCTPRRSITCWGMWRKPQSRSHQHHRSPTPGTRTLAVLVAAACCRNDTFRLITHFSLMYCDACLAPKGEGGRGGREGLTLAYSSVKPSICVVSPFWLSSRQMYGFKDGVVVHGLEGRRAAMRRELRGSGEADDGSCGGWPGIRGMLLEVTIPEILIVHPTVLVMAHLGKAAECVSFGRLECVVGVCCS